MAISISQMTWEVRSSGYAQNGGGFCPPYSGSTGLDYSRQILPYKTFGTLKAVGNNILYCAAPDAFDNTMVGNAVYISGQRRRMISAVYNSTGVALDNNTGTFSGLSGCVGGAVKSPGDIYDDCGYYNRTYVMSGYYYPSGGTMNIQAHNPLIGYGVTRGDNGLAYFECSGMNSSTNAFTLSDHSFIMNIIVANARNNGFAGSNQQNSAVNCAALRSLNNGYIQMQSAEFCFASGNSAGGFNASYVVACVSVTNGTYGFSCRYVVNCIAFNNSTSSTNSNPGIEINSEGGLAVGCISHGNARQRDGFTIPNKTACFNCIATNNGNYGFNVSYTTSSPQEFAGFHGNAAVSNTAGNYNNNPNLFGTNYTLTASPFTDPNNLDFSLNSTNGGGAYIKQSGYIGRLPFTKTIGYLDIGPIQSYPSGAGGVVSSNNVYSMIPNMNGGIL